MDFFTFIIVLVLAIEATAKRGSRLNLKRSGGSKQQQGGGKLCGCVLPRHHVLDSLFIVGSSNINSGGNDGSGEVFTPTLAPIPISNEFIFTDDLNRVRFNKVLFPNDVIPANNKLPLGPEDFPISDATQNFLQQSLCWSVIREDECGDDCETPFSVLIEAIGGSPTHPTTGNIYSEYWGELWEVIQTRDARLRGDSVVSLLKRVPRAWTGYSMEDVAKAVHNEYPGKFQVLD